MRLLPEELVLGVAGELDERPIGEDDRIAGQGGVGDEHRHPGQANGLDEHAPLFSNILDVALRRSSRVRSRKVVLEVVHGGSGCEARRLRGGHHGRAKSASFRVRHASSDSHW